ncbi:hypothetical protein TWF506_008425 [Arthrobotrys conoides]|uniref:Uncharacterized protein n=1 Tax=Arthrobotrys conoides TaxID=74498 RepID=A0AAN8RMQ7_9PEZI
MPHGPCLVSPVARDTEPEPEPEPEPDEKKDTRTGTRNQAPLAVTNQYKSALYSVTSPVQPSLQQEQKDDDVEKP